ncbi:MAG: Rieske 2Fe-2S domain-containing protein [Actinomycetota bacterium]
MHELPIVDRITRIESSETLDPLIDKADSLFQSVLKPRWLRDLLHGVPFGHPLHPVAVQIPIGVWTSAALLDLAPGASRASRALVGIGVISAAPAVAAGWADWLQLHPQQKRVGIVHAAANATALGLYALSYIQRSRGRVGSGKLLAFAGLGVLSAAGFLGGHLAYRQAAGANHAEDVPHLFPEGWHPLGPLADLPEGQLHRVDVAGQPLLTLRHGDAVDVLSNTCSHLSAPLDEGTLIGAGTDDACVECPWHRSTFALRTGTVVHGPATSPLPRFVSRVVDGVVQVMLPGAG